jgi:hypothetical protein
VLSYGQECAQQAYDERKQIKISNLRDQPCSLPRNQNRVGSVEDLDTDPDPEFQVSESGYGSGSGYRGYKKSRKFFFIIKNCMLLFPRPPQRMCKLQKKPSALKREHPELKKMKFITGTYIFFRTIFTFLDPD